MEPNNFLQHENVICLLGNLTEMSSINQMCSRVRLTSGPGFLQFSCLSENQEQELPADFLKFIYVYSSERNIRATLLFSGSGHIAPNSFLCIEASLQKTVFPAKQIQIKYTNARAQERVSAGLPWHISVSVNTRTLSSPSVDKKWKKQPLKKMYRPFDCSEVKETEETRRCRKKREMEGLGGFGLYTAPRTSLTTCPASVVTQTQRNYNTHTHTHSSNEFKKKILMNSTNILSTLKPHSEQKVSVICGTWSFF